MTATATIEWKPVSPRFVLVAFVETLGLLAGPLFVATLPLWVDDRDVERFSWYPLALVGAVALVTLALVPRRVRAIRYGLRDDDVVVQRGILFRRQVAAPYGRLQLVDISRGPLTRLLGLSELRVVTAAASSGVTIPGVPIAEAENLRDHLIAVAESRRAGL
jgi:membrane protein YdbS with pleckstrin-like domain